MRALVTRPAEQARAWCDRLAARGIDAVALPLLEIAAVADDAPLRAAWQRLGANRGVMFVSPAAVRAFFAARPPGEPWPPGTLAASPGPGTAAALREAGVPAAAIVEPAADAGSFDSESLWAVLQPRLTADPVADRAAAHRWLVVRGQGGREWLAAQLAAEGAAVELLAAYRRQAPTLDAAARALLAAALDAPRSHVWLLSSSEAVRHLRDLAGPRLAPARAIASHPRIAEAARAAGFAEVTVVAPRLDDWAAAILSLRP